MTNGTENFVIRAGAKTRRPWRCEYHLDLENVKNWVAFLEFVWRVQDMVNE